MTQRHFLPKIEQLVCLATLGLTIACATEKPPPLPPAPATSQVASSTSTIIPGTSDTVARPQSVDDDDFREEAAAIQTAGGRVTRVGTRLEIRLLNGQTAVLADDTTQGLKFALPRYAGYLKSIHAHSIHQIQYEGYGIYLLLDDSTGDSTILSGKPVPSPDGKRFVITSMQDMEGNNPSLIEIWRMVGRTPETEFTLDTEHEAWDPSDPVWRDSVTIDFIKNTSSSPADPYVKTPGRLVKVDTGWVLVDVSK